MRCQVIVVPPKAPLSTPIVVIPTWMEERNLVGELASSKAILAPGFPFFAFSCNLGLRAEIMAISDLAKNPFRRMREDIMMISR